MIRILLVDDQSLFCEILQNWLQVEPDFEIVGRAGNGQDAIAQVEQLQPDMVIIDIHMPEMDGVTATSIISQRFPKVKVIILSSDDDDISLANALKAGAKGYLLKNTQAQDLASTIRSVDKGYSQIGPGLFEKILKQVPSAVPMPASVTSSAIAPDKLPIPEVKLLTILKSFQADALEEIIETCLTRDRVSAMLSYLYQYLQQYPDNLSALYLSGILSYQIEPESVLAINYLYSGFQEAIKQNLATPDLLLFYQAAHPIDPAAAFSWLTESNSRWLDYLPFLLTQAQALFGENSAQYRSIYLLQQIRLLRNFCDRKNDLQSQIATLHQGFAKINQLDYILNN